MDENNSSMINVSKVFDLESFCLCPLFILDKHYFVYIEAQAGFMGTVDNICLY